MSFNYKNILIRTDASFSIGIGHVMRDLVLAKKFKKSKITFAVQDLDGNMIKEIKRDGYKVKILPNNSKKTLLLLLKKLKIDLLIIDHYSIDKNFEKYIKTNSKTKIFALDDTYEKHYCDILLNHNIYASKRKYKSLVPKSCELRCGSKYTLLRDEFIREKIKRKKTNAKKKSILVAIGGTDHSNINIKILNVLSNIKNIEVNLLTTSANKNLKKLKQYTKNIEWINLHVDSKKVAKLMRKNDIAIITPSVTANEAYYMQIPFIAIKTADNQDEMYKYLKQKKIPTLKKFNKNKLKNNVLILLSKLNMSNNIDLINFTKLNSEESKMVLKWRNTDTVKQWMYNNSSISLDEHLKFIKTLHTKKDSLYFIVKNNDNYIGVIDFTNITNDNANIGLYSNPKISHVGGILMKSIIEYAFYKLNVKKITAEYFTNNERAYNLYKAHKFKIKCKKSVNNREVTCMELKNENR